MFKNLLIQSRPQTFVLYAFFLICFRFWYFKFEHTGSFPLLRYKVTQNQIFFEQHTVLGERPRLLLFRFGVWNKVPAMSQTPSRKFAHLETTTPKSTVFDGPPGEKIQSVQKSRAPPHTYILLGFGVFGA